MKKVVYSILSVGVIIFVILIIARFVDKEEIPEQVKSTEEFYFYEPETSTKDEDEEKEDKGNQSYVFQVAGNGAKDSEIDAEDVKAEDIVVNSIDQIKCLILYNINSTTLYKDYIEDGYAYYEWVDNEGWCIPTFLTVEEKSVSYEYEAFQNYLNEQWCMENSVILLNSCGIETHIGNGNAYMYRQGDNQPVFIAYIDLINEYTCVFTMRGEFEFTSALDVVEDILTNGVTVVMNSTDEDEGEVNETD